MEKLEVNVYPNSNSPQLFRNKILERLTKTHPIVIDMMYVTLSIIFIRHYYLHINQSAGFIAMLFLTGFFSWTLAEYVMHRFLYHKIEDATYKTGIQYLFHGIHHEFPNDQTRLVLPWIPSLGIAAVFYGVFYLLMGSHAFVFSSGFVLGYCAYMTIHKVAAPKNFDFWWRHHNIHHFQQHDRAFGVTTPIWDIVFGTMPEKHRQTVSVKLVRELKKEKNTVSDLSDTF